MKNGAILVDGSNYFNNQDFNKMVELLEQGNEIEVMISCIGHTRNNMEQEEYKKHLEERFGDKLIITNQSGYNSYSYSYKLGE